MIQLRLLRHAIIRQHFVIFSVFAKRERGPKSGRGHSEPKTKTKRKATPKKSSNGKLNPGADSEIFQMREFEKIKCMLINAINLNTNKN